MASLAPKRKNLSIFANLAPSTNTSANDTKADTRSAARPHSPLGQRQTASVTPSQAARPNSSVTAKRPLLARSPSFPGSIPIGTDKKAKHVASASGAASPDAGTSGTYPGGMSQVHARRTQEVAAAAQNAPDPGILENILAHLGPLAQQQEIRALAAELAAAAPTAKAASTMRRYRTEWDAFQRWCETRSLKPYGLPGALAAMYLLEVRKEAWQRGIGYSKVEKASAAISAFHEFSGMPTPSAAPLCSVARELAQRTLIAKPRVREELSWEEVKTTLDFHMSRPPVLLSTIMHLTGAVLCFTGLLRWDDLQHVLVDSHLLRMFPGERLEIYLWRSKTDQHARGETVTIGSTHDPYCPVRMVDRLLQAGQYKTRPEQVVMGGKVLDTEDVGPLIRKVVKGRDGQERLAQVSAPLSSPIPALSYTEFARNINRLFSEAGVQKKIGLHAFRIGGTTAAVNAGGVDRVLVQKLGRWRNAEVMERHYAKDSAEAMTRLTRRMVGDSSE